MSNQPPSIDNLDLLPQRQLNIASLVPALLWQPFFQDKHETLAIGSFDSFDGLIVQMRLYGPSDNRVLDELSVNTPSVMAVAYNTLYAYLISALTDASALIADMSMHHLTAVFPMPEGGRAAQVLHALIGIENAVNNVKGKTPPGYPDIHWNVSAGVSFGKINVAILGNEFLGRKIMLLGGPAKIQSEDALELTRRAQVVVHREVLKQLATAPNGEWLNDDYFLPSTSFRASNVGEVISPQILEEHRQVTSPTNLVQTHRLAAFVDSRIRIRPPFTPLQKGIFSERLTCVTLRLTGMNLPNAAIADRWQKVLEQVFDIATRFGGLINNVVSEVGIGEITILFGVPESQEFMERRAARCALALNRMLAALDVTLQIGIASGKGFAALLGTRFYSDYVVVSPAIDRAKYLANRAESREILSDASIQGATADLFTWREQTTSLVNQEKIYALAGEVSLGSGLKIRHQVTREQTIVGRDDERKAIEEHVQRAVSGDGHVLLMAGESGHGRSTLVDILIGKWLEQDGNGFVSLGPTYSPSAPYSLWIPIWQAIFDLRLDDTVRQKQLKLSRAFSRILPDADGGVAIFSDLLGVTEKQGFSLMYLPPEVRNRRIFDATFTMFGQLSDLTPILLVFEHTDYADELSISLIEKLASALKNKPILFCLEDRRNPAHTLVKNFETIDTITARPISSADAWRYFEQEIPNVSVPYSFQKILDRRLGTKDGKLEIPATDLAALVTVLKSKFFVQRGTRWVANEAYTAQDIPEDAPEAIGWLLMNVVSESERDVAIRASATGISFPHHANWLSSGGSGSASVEIERIEELGLIQRYLDNGLLERWSRFRHETMRETLYSQLDTPMRARLHRSIINWYRTYFPGHASAAIVAAHAERAGDTRETVQAYLNAASFAASWGATSTSMQHLLAAERHLARDGKPNPELMLDLSLTRASLYRSQHQIDRGIEQAEMALKHAYEAASAHAKARSLICRATFAGILEDWETMLGTTTAAYKFAEQTDDKELITEATWLHAKALMANDFRREAVRLLLEALEKSDSELQLEMRLDVARILLVDHYRERANEHIRRLEEQAQKLDNPVLLQQIMSLVGQINLMYGNIDEALHALERALTLPPPPNSGMAPLADVLLNHAVALCYAGRYMDAEAVFDAARDYYLEDGNEDRAQFVEIVRAFELHIDQANWDDIERILDTASDVIDPYIQKEEVDILLDLIRVSVAFGKEDYDAAQELLTKLESQHDSPARRWYLPIVYLRHAELLYKQGKLDESRRYAYKSLGAVGIQGDLRYLTAVYTLLAEAMITQGNHSEDMILDALNRAVMSGRTHGRRIHLARSLLLLGHHLRETSHRFKTRALGSSSLFEAEEIYKEMGISKPGSIASYTDEKEVDIQG